MSGAGSRSTPLPPTAAGTVLRTRTKPFDAVVSAGAFHWLDPRVRFGKSARALRPGGFPGDIAALIDGEYDGSVARNFVYEVITART